MRPPLLASGLLSSNSLSNGVCDISVFHFLGCGQSAPGFNHCRSLWQCNTFFEIPSARPPAYYSVLIACFMSSISICTRLCILCLMRCHQGFPDTPSVPQCCTERRLAHGDSFHSKAAVLMRESAVQSCALLHSGVALCRTVHIMCVSLCACACACVCVRTCVAVCLCLLCVGACVRALSVEWATEGAGNFLGLKRVYRQGK